MIDFCVYNNLSCVELEDREGDRVGTGKLLCVYVFLSCEITSKTKVIVVTEAQVRCEIDLLLTNIFLVFSQIGVRVRLGRYQLKTRRHKKDSSGTISQTTQLQGCVCM